MSFSLSDQHRRVLLNNVTYHFLAERKIIDILIEILTIFLLIGLKTLHNVFK